MSDEFLIHWISLELNTPSVEHFILFARFIIPSLAWCSGNHLFSFWKRLFIPRNTYGIVRLRGCTQKSDMKTPLTFNQQKHEGDMGEAHGVGPHNEINYLLSLLSAVHVWSSPEHPCCVQEQPDPDHQLHPGLGAVAREGIPGERTRRE